MELTNELKARFIMLYYGQQVLYIQGRGLEFVDTGWNLQNPYFYLELRPLSSITEEEAIECCNFLYGLNVTPSHKTNIRLITDYLRDINTSHNNYGYLTHTKFQDWIRSKGFAIDFMGIPVDQWVKWGVVKLKTA